MYFDAVDVEEKMKYWKVSRYPIAVTIMTA
jgi:hypothetical protein